MDSLEQIVKITKSYVKTTLKRRLNFNMHYHNWEHVEDVIDAVSKLAKAENIDKNNLNTITIAAALHDIGYCIKYIGHEEESVKMARKFLQKKLSVKDIEKVCALIMATKNGYVAKSVEEKIIIDADRCTMGSFAFIKRGNLLRKEWAANLNQKHTDLEWVNRQIIHLKNTPFLTNSAKNFFDTTKSINLIKLQKLKKQALYRSSIKINKSQWHLIAFNLFNSLFGYLLVGIFVGLSLSIAAFELTWLIVLSGIISGFIIGTLMHLGSNFYEGVIFNKLRFPVVMLSSTVILTALFFCCYSISFLFVKWLVFPKSVNGQIINLLPSLMPAFGYVIFTSFLYSLLINTIKLSGKIMGVKVLWNYFLGKYHKPREEERIFMFVDINSSTSLAEKMGSINYHRLLNRFFNDIAKPIRRFGGEIYQYVGDEVSLTWPIQYGLKNMRCVKCFFEIKKTMENLKPEYVEKFGFFPEFKVGLHGGSIIAGEVGVNKKEIVFHGDAINTTERILNQCIALDAKILISESLLKRLNLDGTIKADYLTTKLFKGKEKEVSLYTLRQV